MFMFPLSSRPADRPAAGRPRTRRPLVEELEGRRLPSGIVGNHITVSVAPAIVGNHIGVSDSGSARGVSSAGPDTVRFYNL